MEVFPTAKHALSTSKSNQAQSSSTVVVPQSSTQENEKFKDNERKRMSKDTLNSIVRQYLLMENDDAFKENFESFRSSIGCDNYFVYRDRIITKLLLFDLVTEQRLFCSLRYINSSSLSSKKLVPHKQIQSNVFHILDKDVYSDMFRNRRRLKESVLDDPQKYVNDLLVEDLIISELKTEEQRWNNYEKEKDERTRSVSDEVFSDLLSDTVSIFRTILKKKISTSLS